jgi:hypothetical protein
MSQLNAADTRSTKGGRNQYQHLTRMVSYPPPATGVNFNLIVKVEHDESERVVWHIINSPDGRFVYDHHLVRAPQEFKRLCFDCRRVEVRGIKRLCTSCASSRKRVSNRESQSKRRSRVRKTGFSPIHAEPLTQAKMTIGYPNPPTSISDSGFSTHEGIARDASETQKILNPPEAVAS